MSAKAAVSDLWMELLAQYRYEVDWEKLRALAAKSDAELDQAHREQQARINRMMQQGEPR